jgi:hypothetical protein
VDAAFTGRTEGLGLPGRVTRVAAGERAALDGALDLDAGAHLLAVEGDVETFVRFDGPARLRPAAPDGERGAPQRARTPPGRSYGSTAHDP